MNPTDISRVRVTGLHQQFHVDLELQPGLNVLYGKNGKGKTTLLHILANFKELDFSRFRHLQFDSIEIQTWGNDVFSIEKEHSNADERGLSVRLNGMRVGGDGPLPNLQSVDRAALRSRVGGRPVYLPAFRAILERVKSDAYAPPTPGREKEFERLREEERQVQKEADTNAKQHAGMLWSPRNDISALTARKTLQCREWFGPFVPVIRYPSILEVVDRLSTEFRDAQVETGMHERQMLSQMFIEVFKALLSNDESPSGTEVEDLLARVRRALAAEGDSEQELYTDRVGSRLAGVMSLDQLEGAQRGGAAERRVLKLYAETLEQRNAARQRAFAKVRQFEQAVNKFLDEKELHVSDDRLTDRRNSVSLGVYVKTAGDRTYGLSALSSGERQILTMLFSATRMSGATGTFLIDEPELSLHIDWQRIVLSELMTQVGGRQIVACTHSPEVGADHMDALQVFSPEQALFQLPSRPEDAPDTFADESL